MTYDNYELIPDDLGSNVLELTCTYLTSRETAATVASYDYQPFGDWMSKVTCPEDYFMVSFRMRMEQDMYSSDDIATVDFNFKCRGPGLSGTAYTDLAGVGLDMGTWGSWSDECPPGSAICAVQTFVEDCSTESDCTTINDAKFVCCDF